VVSDQQEDRNKITLCMIVKDEAPIILRALKSVKHIVDYYCICDTGSSDDTPQLIEEYFDDNNLDGVVFGNPWKNFSYNRTKCFTLAKETFRDADYLMTLDADEVIVPYKGEPKLKDVVTKLPSFEEDKIYIPTVFGNLLYDRATFFKASLNWEWIGVVHEYAHAEDSQTTNKLAEICNFPRAEGARSREGNKAMKDAELLKEALLEEPENSRHWFYLAQSYADVGKYHLALPAIEKAIETATWIEEKYLSLLRKARYKKAIGIPFAQVVGEYLAAYEFFPSRVEPLYDIISYYRSKDEFKTAALFIEKARTIAYPEGCILFVEKDVYDWKLLDEVSLVYYYTGEVDKALALGMLLEEKTNIPAAHMKRIKKNIKHFNAAAKKSTQL